MERGALKKEKRNLPRFVFLFILLSFAKCARNSQSTYIPCPICLTAYLRRMLGEPLDLVDGSDGAELAIR